MTKDLRHAGIRYGPDHGVRRARELDPGTTQSLENRRDAPHAQQNLRDDHDIGHHRQDLTRFHRDDT